MSLLVNQFIEKSNRNTLGIEPSFKKLTVDCIVDCITYNELFNSSFCQTLNEMKTQWDEQLRLLRISFQLTK